MSVVLTAQAQWQENFSDGNFTSNPAWMGDTAEWVVNDTFALQSNCQRSNHFFQLRTASTPALSVRWEITVRLGFNTSSVNYVDIYLISADMDLGSASNTAYFVRLGGSTDEISLYRK